ncbi:hypothetical protein D3C85_1686560 [compost metagenome]
MVFFNPSVAHSELDVVPGHASNVLTVSGYTRGPVLHVPKHLAAKGACSVGADALGREHLSELGCVHPHDILAGNGWV